MIIYFQLKLMKPKTNVVTIFCTAIMTKQNRKEFIKINYFQEF